MSEASIQRTITTLMTELVDGARADSSYVLNPGDPGLVQSLDKLSAAAASARPPGGGPSIAAHVDHLRYGFELINRWSPTENPFATADYGQSWIRLTVSDEEWATLRSQLREEVTKARERVVPAPDRLSHVELTGLVGSVVHLAYHLGAMRQVDRSIRGPAARD